MIGGRFYHPQEKTGLLMNFLIASTLVEFFFWLNFFVHCSHVSPSLLFSVEIVLLVLASPLLVLPASSRTFCVGPQMLPDFAFSLRGPGVLIYPIPTSLAPPSLRSSAFQVNSPHHLFAARIYPRRRSAFSLPTSPDSNSFHPTMFFVFPLFSHKSQAPPLAFVSSVTVQSVFTVPSLGPFLLQSVGRFFPLSPLLLPFSFMMLWY